MADHRPAAADRAGAPRPQGLPVSTSDDYRYQKRWRYDRAHGITRTMPADPIRTHLRDLIEGGASVRGIGEVAGVPASVVSRIARGQQPTVTRRLAAALGAVTMSSLTGRANPQGFVPKIGAVRRIQAMQALGHSAKDIAAGTGLGDRDVYNVVNQAGQWISRAKWEAIVAAYQALSMTLGTNRHALIAARRAGYPPPLAWDEEDLDDPHGRPRHDARGDHVVDEVAVEAGASGRHTTLTGRERAEVVRWLAGGGCSDATIAARLRVSDRTVLRIRLRHGIASRWVA